MTVSSPNFCWSGPAGCVAVSILGVSGGTPLSVSFGNMSTTPQRERFLIRTILLLVGGGAVGFLVTWILMFCFPGGPVVTTSLVNGILRDVAPVAVICGILAGWLVAFRLAKQRRCK